MIPIEIPWHPSERITAEEKIAMWKAAGYEVTLIDYPAHV